VQDRAENLLDPHRHLPAYRLLLCGVLILQAERE
jgi:hypothetical protein